MTQTAAKKMLRNLTGRSIAWAETQLDAMTKEIDGCREKVFVAEVEAAIERANRPTPRKTVAPIKPLTLGKRQQIRALGLVPRRSTV